MKKILLATVLTLMTLLSTMIVSEIQSEARVSKVSKEHMYLRTYKSTMAYKKADHRGKVVRVISKGNVLRSYGLFYNTKTKTLYEKVRVLGKYYYVKTDDLKTTKIPVR